MPKRFSAPDKDQLMIDFDHIPPCEKDGATRRFVYRTLDGYLLCPFCGEKHRMVYGCRCGAWFYFTPAAILAIRGE